MTSSTTISTTRTVRVTAGDIDYVWFTATEITGKDITADSVLVGFGTWYEPPASPITPNGASDQTEHPTPASVRVGLLIGATSTSGAHVIAPGKYEGWIKVSDSPTVAWVRCGPVEII